MKLITVNDSLRLLLPMPTIRPLPENDLKDQDILIDKSKITARVSLPSHKSLVSEVDPWVRELELPSLV
jgi:hypothetical protein